MKKVVLVGIMFLMFMGVVCASSINGEYKGNPVVKLLNNGVEIVASDTPAMIYDNRTMVPIYLLRKMGAIVTWDLDKYSVDVVLPQTAATVNNAASDNSVTLIKYAKLANIYKLTEDFSARLSGYSNTLSLYFDGHNINNPNAYTDKYITDTLSQIIDHYNFISNKYNAMNSELTEFNTSDLGNAIKADFDAIDRYKTALTNITDWNSYRNKYDNTNSQSSFNSYLTNSNSGFTLSNQSIKTCDVGYNLYILKVIN